MNTPTSEPQAAESLKPLISGFLTPNENWSKLPHEFIDLLPDLTEAELRVTLYILRHTWGYGEYGQVKRITLDEFEFGRKDREGQRMDRGCGVQRKAIERGLERAVQHGLVTVETDDSDKARIKKYYGIHMSGVTQMSLKDRSGDLKDSSGDPKDRAEGSLRLIDQRKNLLKETEKKEEKIDHARDSLSSSTDIQITPEPPAEPTPQSEAPISPPVTGEEDDPDYPAKERHATFEAVKQRLLAEGYAPDASVDPLPKVEMTPIPFHIANGFGMSGYSEPYWQAYQRGGDGFFIEQRKPHDAEVIAAEFKRLDVTPDDVEAIIRNYLPTRKAGSRFTFEFALREVRKWKVNQSAPIERDPVLVAVVQTGWGYASDTDASNRIVDFLSGAISEQDAWQDWGKHQLKGAPMTPSELQRFIGWYRSQSKDRSSPPRTAKSLRENIDTFRATQRLAVSPVAPSTFTPPPRSAPLSAEDRARIKLEVQARQQTEGATP